MTVLALASLETLSSHKPVAEPVRQDRIGALQGSNRETRQWLTVLNASCCPVLCCAVLAAPRHSLLFSSRRPLRMFHQTKQDLHDHERSPSTRLPINLQHNRDRGLFPAEKEQPSDTRTEKAVVTLVQQPLVQSAARETLLKHEANRRHGRSGKAIPQPD